ncbi:MAG: NAD(P)H-hydrate dehydratase, partial [Desulfovibrionaceae bacterium]|nr:NAD(P)H-hydrate dehydratase [Desulfovibrionaceae bacterium]
MFISLATPFEMIQSDTTTIKQYGLPAELLMENAGRESFSSIEKEYGTVANRRVFVFAGSGNNGGDGIVLARYLKEAGAHVIVILEREPELLPKVSSWHYYIAKKYGIQFVSVQEFYTDIAFSIKPDIIIDALVGVGFTGILRDNLQKRIQYINSFSNQAYIVALDIPSGIHCFTGTPSPIAVKADMTITFHIGKVGLYMPTAREYVGKIMTCNIGMPEKVNQKKYQALLYPPEKPNIQQNLHKHSAGRVLIIGGSEEYIGAPIFCAKAAYKMGAGSVTIATLERVADTIRSNEYDTLITPLQHTNWGLLAFHTIQPLLEIYDTVIVGPGMGSSPGVKDFVFAMLQNPRPITIFDADAVRTIPLLHTSIRSFLTSTDILTPHIGELSQMLNTSPQNIQKNKLDIAHMCKQSEAITVIKDAGTIITQKNEPITLSPFTIPNLAIAGSGDILSGMIAGECLKKKSPFLATCSAVYYHAQVGESLRENFPLRGNTPEDIIEHIPL